MPIPGNAEITQYECEVDPTLTDSGCEATADCYNPLYALDHQDTCGAITITSLRLEPDVLRVPLGRQSLVRVVASFSTGQEADVTEDATVVTGNGLIAEHSGHGLVKGLLVGSTTLTGVWRGRVANGTATVFDSACLATQLWDVVFVLDESIGTYLFREKRALVKRPWSATVNGAPVATGFQFLGEYWREQSAVQFLPAIDAYADFVLAMQLSMDLLNTSNPDLEGNDRVAVVLTGGGTPVVPEGWTNSVQVVTPEARHAATVAGALGTLQSVNGLGLALQAAQTLFNTAREDARKLVVVVTHGAETSCNPPARTIAQELRASGVDVAVVTPVPPASLAYSTCSHPLRVFDHLQAMASPCLFYSGMTTSTAPNVFSRILSDACEEGCGGSGSGLGVGLF